MTSPNSGKPEGISGDYDDVHSRGSSFGQDLSAKGVRDNLLGTNTSWFERIGNSFVDAVGHIGGAIEYGLSQIFSPDEPTGPPPPMYENLAAAVKRASTPIYSMADQAVNKANTAQAKADSLNEDLTGSIDGDMSEAAENYSGIVGQINQEAKKFGQWEVEHQEDLNASFSLALSAQEQINDVNAIQWQTQADYNEQNNRINQAQTDALMYHENQMLWNQWTAVRHWWVGTHPYSDGWISLELVPSTPSTASHLIINPTEGWAGSMTVFLRYGDFESFDLVNYQVDGSGDTLTYYAGSQLWNYTSAAVIATPYWGPAPREYLLKPTGDPTENGYGFQSTEAYFNEKEQNPISWSDDGSIAFSNVAVRPSSDVWVYETADGQWVYPNGYGNDTIPPGYYIRANEDSLVKFTEVK